MGFKHLLSQIKYEVTKWYYFKKSNTLINKAISDGECYIGPFVGEFGHLLSHIVPFVGYLHSKGVKIKYMGPSIHLTFFVDSDGNPIVSEYNELRDFYSEITPNCNDLNLPDDVREIVNRFIRRAKKSDACYFDLSRKKYYWFGICLYMFESRRFKIYPRKLNQGRQNQVVLFARKKGDHSNVRGDNWDFQQLVDEIIDKTTLNIVILGHPAFSHSIESNNRVEVKLTSDNSLILEECAKSKFIINQLSGTHYLGLYTNTEVLLLLKGKHVNFSNYLKDLRYRLLLDPDSSMFVIKSKTELLSKLSMK